MRCYLHFAKSFDSVSHAKLLHVVSLKGLEGSWIGGLLNGRTQSVNGCRSSSIQEKSGVLKGSAQGPRLFITNVSDLAQIVKLELILYADNCAISFACSRYVVNLAQLQNDLDDICCWIKGMQLTLSVSKCRILKIDNVGSGWRFSLSQTVNWLNLMRSWTQALF